MPEMPSFEFDGYTLRPAVGDADLALAAAWMEGDRWHRGQFKPEFWLEQSAVVNSFVLEDALGPVFFFKTQQLRPFQGLEGRIFVEVELFIQFAPGGVAARLRAMQAMDKGFAWLKKKLGERAFDAVYFTSRNPQLIEFAEKRLGFVICAISDDGTRLKAYLERAA